MIVKKFTYRKNKYILEVFPDETTVIYNDTTGDAIELDGDTIAEAIGKGVSIGLSDKIMMRLNETVKECL